MVFTPLFTFSQAKLDEVKPITPYFQSVWVCFQVIGLARDAAILEPDRARNLVFVFAAASRKTETKKPSFLSSLAHSES